MSRPASSESFYSALSDHGMADEEAISTPVRSFRPAKPITNEIQQHCHIFFDEQLYLSALTLLSDLVTAGTSHPDYPNLPTIAPLPFHIELVSCLLVHPRWTTQANPSEQNTLQARAITLLRNILVTLGPLNARLNEAFSFAHTYNARPKRRGRTFDRDDGVSGSDEENAENMRGVIANEGRLRRCASDFWHALGWAFNCSVRYPKRWKCWKIWLDYLLDVLDDDWKERARLDEEVHRSQPQASETQANHKMLKDCLLLRYLSDVKGQSSAVRRIAKAIFADGSSDSLREFPEIFKNETRELKIENAQKRKRADTTKERAFGGYDEEIAEEDLHSPDFGMSEDEDEASTKDDVYLGGVESTLLRQRIFALLSRASAEFPDEFVDIVDLYEAIYLCMRPLSIPSFMLFLAPSQSSYIPEVAQVSLTQFFLRRMISNAAPHPTSIRERNSDEFDLNILEKCFFPFAALTTSVNENAKVSIMIEVLFRIFLKSCDYGYSRELEPAVDKGIKAREAMIKSNKRKKSTSAKQKVEAAEQLLLKASGVRLRNMVSFVKHQKSKDAA